MDLIYRLDPFAPLVPRFDVSPAQAIKLLEEGNAMFVHIANRLRQQFHDHENHIHAPLIVPFDPMTFGISLVEGQAVKQSPFALVLGCSDARAPIELIFQQTCNDLFVVRVAGNVLGTECLGSIDYAVRNLGDSLKLVVVLGHTNCGAVSAAVNMYLDPSDYIDLGLTHSLRSLVDRIMIGVRGAARTLERLIGPDVVEKPGYKAALLELAVYLNAALTAFDLKRELKALGENHGIEVVYGVFDIVSQQVRANPRSTKTFNHAPSSLKEFENIEADLIKAVFARDVLNPRDNA